MKLRIASEDYFLDFVHTNEPYLKQTTAILYKDEKAGGKVIAQATAKVYHKDQFNKAKGRKVALAKLIQTYIFPAKGSWNINDADPLATDTLTKDHSFLERQLLKTKRQLIWEQYFKTCKR